MSFPHGFWACFYGRAFVGAGTTTCEPWIEARVRGRAPPQSDFILAAKIDQLYAT